MTRTQKNSAHELVTYLKTCERIKSCQALESGKQADERKTEAEKDFWENGWHDH